MRLTIRDLDPFQGHKIPPKHVKLSCVECSDLLAGYTPEEIPSRDLFLSKLAEVLKLQPQDMVIQVG